MLLDDIKKEQMMALKERNPIKRSALENVYSKGFLVKVEMRAKGQEMTDADVLKVIQKVIKELEEERDAFKTANRMEKVGELEQQIEILNAYLPKQLTEEEVRKIVESLPDKSLPVVMKYFKENYAGRCDMKMVSTIANSYKNA